MHRAIMQRRAVCAFPFTLVLLTALLRHLPVRFYDRIMRPRVRRNP
jgi:hypothetical protein